MPWIEGAHCPTCEQKVAPKPGDLLTACLCGMTVVGIDKAGELVVGGPDGVTRERVWTPYREQLSLPLGESVSARKPGCIYGERS